MKVVLTLGNPGRAYEATPHNIGFDVADILAGRWCGRFEPWKRERADAMEVFRDGEKTILAKPMTFMNLSGETAAAMLRNRPAEIEDVLVVCDDVNLDIGRVRIRPDGSHGGQNGLRSIIASLGGPGFARLRVGVRGKKPIHDMSKYVLSAPPPKDRQSLAHMAEIAADAVESWLRTGWEETAQEFNGYRMPETK